jgi:asparagine synthase (glutamine-hydrolysing)
MQNKAKRNASLSSGDFLSGGTRYYLEQRVPNFYANGISMYNSSASWRSPFHNIRWLEKIWNLCDNWKLGSNWHRLAIYRNFPALLEFPEEKGFDTNRMLRKAPPLYWLPIMQKQKYKTYDMSADWFAQPEIQDLIWENNQLIDELIDKKLIRKILDEHVADKTRTRAISFLLTILCFKLSMKRQVQ